MPLRPFRVLGVQQIAIGALDRKPLLRLWRGLLGLSAVTTYSSEVDNVVEDILEVGVGDARVEVDLMQPLDPLRSPKVHVPPLNHIGLWVDDLPAAVSWLSEQGVRMAGGIRKGASGHDIAFIHPKGSSAHPLSGEGVLIELVQAPAELVQRLSEPSAQS